MMIEMPNKKQWLTGSSVPYCTLKKCPLFSVFYPSARYIDFFPIEFVV